MKLKARFTAFRPFSDLKQILKLAFCHGLVFNRTTSSSRAVMEWSNRTTVRKRVDGLRIVVKKNLAKWDKVSGARDHDDQLEEKLNSKLVS